MTVEIGLAISVISVSFALVTGILSLRRNNKNDDTAQASQITTVIVKLENIADDLKEIKENIRGVEEKVQTLDKRVTVIEQTARSAHARIDVLAGTRTGWEVTHEDG